MNTFPHLALGLRHSPAVVSIQSSLLGPHSLGHEGGLNSS